MAWTHPTKVVVATALAASAGALYGFAPMFGLEEYQIFLEAAALMATVMMCVVVGIALEANWMSKRQSRRICYVLDCGLVVIVVVVVVAAWGHTIVQYVGVVDLGVYKDIPKAAILVILIVIGVMLGIKLGTRYGMISIGDAANASRDKHHARSITDVELRDGLYCAAYAFLGIMVIVVVMSASTSQPTYPVKPDTLFTASATIMGFAAFGSALSILGLNKDLIKGIAYMLIPVIAVQTVFILSFLVDCVVFPAAAWIILTSILLMLLVLAMVANRMKSAGMGGDTGPLRYF